MVMTGEANDLSTQEQPFVSPASAVLEKPKLRLDDVRLYKLHKKSVVKVSALPFFIPDTIKRYLLHGDVVRMDALDAVSVIG